MNNLYALIYGKLLNWLLVYPTAGFSAVYAYFQFENKQWGQALIGATGLIIAIVAASFVKLKLGTQQLTVTDNKNNSDTSVELVKLSHEEMAREREFWAKRVDEVAARMRAECEAEKKYWTEREEKIRDEKHKLGNQCNAIAGNYRLLVKQLAERGVVVTEDITVVWPERLKRTREKDDPKVISGEFSMKEERAKNE